MLVFSSHSNEQTKKSKSCSSKKNVTTGSKQSCKNVKLKSKTLLVASVIWSGSTKLSFSSPSIWKEKRKICSMNSTNLFMNFIKRQGYATLFWRRN